MPRPEVLVVLPTLGDRLETLEDTLNSVDEQRSEVDLTLVVVLPSSATEARDLATQHDAIVLNDPGTGISAAINRALLFRGVEKYYAWIGDDDLFRPNGLLTLKTMLDAESDAVLAFGGCDYIDLGGRVLAKSNAGALAPFLLAWGPDLIPHPGSMIRLDALIEVGGFDPGLNYAMDLDAFLKLRRHGRFIWTREPVSAFRWHPGSLTVANRLNSSLESERVKKRHLPLVLRPFSPLWHYPVRWASALAARIISSHAR